MSVKDQFEREEEMLDEDLNNGAIGVKEYNTAMADLQREYAEEARYAADEAYDDELDRW